MLTQFLRLAIVSSLVLTGVGTIPGAAARERPTIEESARLFRQRVAAYVQLHRDQAAQLVRGGIDPDENGGAIFRQALANGIRASRHHAQSGDVLYPGFAPVLVQAVRADIGSRSFTERQAILSSVPRVLQVRVNDSYPTGAPLATVSPLLLTRFLALPPELQYRFLDRALILLDVDANLIVDFIPGALPRY